MAKIYQQVLSNESPNDRHFVVLNDGIDWSRFEKNPVLLRDHDWDSPIGNVLNIHFDEGKSAWVGEFHINGTSEIAKQSLADYESGVLRAASISGEPFYREDENGLKVCTRFIVYEISLVVVPSNPDCVNDFKGETPVLSVEFQSEKGKEHEIVEFSAKENEMVTKFMSKMEKTGVEVIDEVVNNDAKKSVEDKHTVPANSDLECKFESKNADEDADKGLFAKFKEFISSMREEKNEESKGDNVELNADEANVEESVVSEKKNVELEAEKPIDETKDVELEELKAEKHDDSKILDTKTIEELKSNKVNKMEKMITLSEFLNSKEGQVKFSAGARYASLNANNFNENDKEVEYLREFVSIAKNDAGFMKFMGNIGFSVDGTYKGTLKDAVNNLESFASGINSGTWAEGANVDLGKLQWLSLFYKKLLPDDSWASRIARINGQGVAGVIWVDSAIAPDIYFGSRAPLNVSDATYNDAPVGLAEKVFAMRPITWQQANTDILAYNDVATGTSEALRILTSKMHNYYLQKIAEAAPASAKVATTGSSYAAANNYPSNASAAGNFKAITPSDITALQTKFINQNYMMETFAAELVLPSIYHAQLQSDSLLSTLLTKNAGALRPNFGEYAGFTFRPRSLTALYSTSTSAVTDAELYLDGKIQSDGTIASYTPPTLAAGDLDAAIGFIPSEVIIALGRTNVHMVSNPSSYGWTMSMDVRTACGAARANKQGIGLIVPATA